MELETQVQIALNLGYWSADQADLLLRATAELGRIMNGLLNSLDD